MRNLTRRSKSPLPPQPTACLCDTTEDAIASSPEGQVGGGRRSPSPPLETPTRLRTRVKPSEKARDNTVVQQAELRRARMGNITGGTPLGIDDHNTGPSLPLSTAIFSGPHPQNETPVVGDSSSTRTLGATDNVVTAPRDFATCNDLQVVPTMRIIPPTPLPGENADGHTSSGSISSAGPLTPTSGRRTAAINATLSAGYDELEAILNRLVERTNLSTQQILDGWHKSRSRVVSGINHWNQYTKYAMRHEEQERRRLNLPQEVILSPGIRRQLYAKFKEDNTDTWQEILEVHDIVDDVQSSPQTIAQRAQTFNKIKKRIISMMESESAKHGFESAFIMCGSVVNEDASLGFTHTTGGATKFFEMRCRADSNAMIGHLKAHVYNRVSLETVNEAFGNDGDQSKESLLPAPAALRVPSEGVEEHTNDDIMTNIKDSLITLIQSAGGDVSKFKRSAFPWTTLLNFLTTQGLVVKGWPDDVLMPGKLRHPGARTKGIADLSNAERRRLQQSLLAGQITVNKLSGRDERCAISEYNVPVIIGAPPPPGSGHTRAQQMYGNGTFDFGGPERLPPTAAATRIKQKRFPKATSEDPIVISSSSDDGAARIIPAKKKGDATAKGKKKAVVITDSSGDDVDIAKGVKHSLLIDIDETSEEDYQEPRESRKRKAKKPMAPGRVSKKPAMVPPQSNRGSKHARPIKGSKTLKSTKYVEVSDSDTDETVKAQKVPEARPAFEKDVFDRAVQEPVPGTASRVFLPSTPMESPSARPPDEPSSPSPKCRTPLLPLTERDTSHKLTDPEAASVTPSGEVNVRPPVLSVAASIASAPCEVAVTVAPPALLTSEVAGTVPTRPSEQVVGEPELLSRLSEAPVPHMGADTAMTFSNPMTFSQRAAPSLPHDERLTYGEWVDQNQQMGGGYPSHAFQTPQLSYPYNGSAGGMVAPMQMRRGMMDRRQGMYPNSGSHRDDLLVHRPDAHGDPRGPYGGLYTCAEGLVMYPDIRDPFLGVRPSPHPSDFCAPGRQSSVVPPDTNVLGTRPSPHPAPGPSRRSSVHPPFISS